MKSDDRGVVFDVGGDEGAGRRRAGVVHVLVRSSSHGSASGLG